MFMINPASLINFCFCTMNKWMHHFPFLQGLKKHYTLFNKVTFSLSLINKIKNKIMFVISQMY